MNTPPMSHAGNWERNPRKLALERSRAAARAQREQAAEPPATSQVIYLWGDEYNFLALHPCATQRMGMQPKVSCAGCRRTEDLDLHALLRTKYAHRPWAEVMPVLRCSSCRHPPFEVAFYDLARANPEWAYAGKLSFLPPPEGQKPPVTWTEDCDPRTRSTLHDGRPPERPRRT